MNLKRLLTFAGGALLAVVVAGGVAYATIPDQNNVYRACVLKGVGQVRLIDKSLPSTNPMSHCTANETEVSWNQAGQPGPPGPQGTKGDPGPAGTNGNNGTDGKDGQSVTTAPEPAGRNCAAGGVQLTAVNGLSYVCNGERGPQGDRGPQGESGAQGPKGDQGATGPQGPPGPGGTGLTSLADLNGLPCTLPPTSTPGVVRVTVGPDPGGAISLKCDSGVAFTSLGLEVRAHCSGPLGLDCGHQTSITVGAPISQSCSVTSTSSSSPDVHDCSFTSPTGTVLQLTGTTPGSPIWGGACAGVTGSVCSITLTGNNMFVSLDY
jgi:hypothetical protein